MFTKKDIEFLFDETYSEFSKKHRVKCSLKFVNSDEFSYLAKTSEVVKEGIKEGALPLVGAFVMHSPKKDEVYLSIDLLNEISAGNKDFVKALFMHELYHILLKNQVKAQTLSEEVESEIRAREKMMLEFPKLAKYIV